MPRTFRPRVGSAACIVALGLSLTGCTAGAGGEAPSNPPSATAAPSVVPTAEASAEPLRIPGVTVDEIARSEFVSEGSDGIPTTSATIRDAVTEGETLTLEGACVGTSAEFAVRTAGTGGDTDVLVQGTLDCAEPLSMEYALDYAGPVQVDFTDADHIDEGWLRLSGRSDAG